MFAACEKERNCYSIFQVNAFTSVDILGLRLVQNLQT